VGRMAGIAVSAEPSITDLEIPPYPHSAGVAFAVRFYQNLQGRPHDPVEALEREAHFETHKAKGAKK
jgi:hypothetical protein